MPRYDEFKERQQVMNKFGICEADCRDPRIKNLLKEKVEIDQEIRELRKDENFFTDARIRRGLSDFGLSVGDLKRPKVAQLLKGILHGQATIAGLTAAPEEPTKTGKTNA